jgi:FkbM family methyltransferase
MTFRRRVVGFVPNKFRIRKRALQAWRRGERELRLVPLLCERHALAIDVGANYGIYSYFLSKYSAGVVAFEPVPEYASFIRSALPAVRVVESAVSDRAGDAILWIPVQPTETDSPTLEFDDTLGNTTMRGRAVRLVTLDSFDDLRPVGFIKIDVEGHELSVLNGALGIIERDRPTILVEAEERHRSGSVASIRDLLSNRGYNGFFLFRGCVESIEAFDHRTHQDLAKLSLDFSASVDAEYVNNFIFVHGDKEEITRRLHAGEIRTSGRYRWPRRNVA